MNFHTLEHKILKVVTQNHLRSQSLLIAISGGRDSMVLLHLLAKISKAAALSIRCVHIHHGISTSARQNNYRDSAQKFCEKRCKSYGFEFVTNEPKVSAVSTEEDLRNFRLAQIANCIRDKEILTLGHHSQDLLETRLMRLVRGVSFNGLQSMRVLAQRKFRPLLNFSSKEIQSYAEQFKIQFVEDPSNQDLRPLRNWMRKAWIPALENRNPGSAKSLSKSMELFLETGARSRPVSPLPKSFNKHCLDLLSERTVLRLVRQLYFDHYCIKVTDAQVSEVRKQLYNSKKSHRFTIAQVLWVVNAQQVITAKAE